MTNQHRRVQVWYTSDLHIGHRLVAGLRGFDESESHDAQLARRWDHAMSGGDTVWVLGDISAGGRGGQRRALDWLAQRPGVRHLIAGNHDGVHPMHIDAHKMLPTYLDVFASVQQSARRKLSGQTLLLSHFPTSLRSVIASNPTADSTSGAYPTWEPGCCTGTPTMQSDSATSQSTSASTRGDFAPVSIDTIAQIMHNSSLAEDVVTGQTPD